MGRTSAIVWHGVFSLVCVLSHAFLSIGAGVLYFYFVLPRWPELMGDTDHTLGTVLRIASGALIGLAALPVVFVLLRTRKPEFGTPQLALSMRTWSIVAHVLAGVLIIGTAISEIWLSLDAAGRYLFAIYGAAAAIALLGFFAFYLSFVAELPPPPPKPIKAKKEKKPRKRGIRRKKDEETAEAAETEAAEPVDAEEAEAVEVVEATADTEVAEAPEERDTPEPTEAPEAPAAPTAEDTDRPQTGLRNRRPAGKGSHRLRRRSTGGVAMQEAAEDER